MAPPPKPSRLNWPQLGVFALLGGLVVLGLGANGVTLMQSLAALGFGAGVLLLAQLWQATLRRTDAAPRAGLRRVWTVVVFVAWLATMAALIWWCMTNRAASSPPPLPPRSCPADQDDAPAEQTAAGARPSLSSRVRLSVCPTHPNHKGDQHLSHSDKRTSGQADISSD